MKKLNFLFVSMIMVLFLAGCGNENSAGEKVSDKNFCTITDDSGREVILPQKPQRIAVTSVSFLEPLNAVGGEVIARPSSKTKVPDFAKSATEIGAVYQIDTEKLLACQPDLVIINKGMNEKLSAILEENKINFVIAEMKGYDSVKKNISMFAEITGQVDEGKKVVEKMDAEIKNITDKLPKEKKRVAILHSTAQGLSVQLDNSIAGNVLKILGWENVASEMQATKDGGDTAPYSLETLIEQNPEIIFVTSMGNIDEIKNNMEQMINENVAWQTIPAIKNNKIYYLPQDLFLFSPGIHYPEAVKYVAKLIYSEIEF